MSLEQAMEKYADALNKHTEVLTRALEQGVALIGPAASVTSAVTTETPVKPEPPKRGPKPKKAEPEPETKTEDADDFEEADDFEDSDAAASETTKVTAEQIKDLMFKVKDKKSVEAARAILAEVGVKTIAQIPEASFNKVVALAAKAGVKL